MRELERTELDRDIVWECNNFKLLGIILDNNLKFDIHLSKIFEKKTSRKLSVLTRVAKFLSFKKRCILFKAFIEL